MLRPERSARCTGVSTGRCGGGPMTGLVLVTGAAGFIGSNVCRAFAESGRRVVGCDRMRQGGKWRNLVDVGLHDLITPEDLPRWLERQAGSVDLIVHLGAVSATTETDVDRIYRDNIRNSLDLWDWCSVQRVPLIYASSAATYGTGGAGFEDVDEPDALARLRPLNAYGWSKHVVDRRITADAHGGQSTPPRWAGLKFFNVYGPGEDCKGEMRSVISKIISGVQAGEAVTLFRSHREGVADGEQQRDFVYVDDVVAVICWLATAPVASGLFNIGSGKARTWNDLARATFAACGKPPQISYVDMPLHIREHYQYFTQAPVGKLRQAGWNQPFTTLEEGVARTVAARG